MNMQNQHRFSNTCTDYWRTYSWSQLAWSESQQSTSAVLHLL